MNGITTQEQRLDYLVEAFKTDSGAYRNLDIPDSIEGKKRVLRSLMNIRMPGKMDAAVLKVQDEYLRSRAEEKGIVTLSDIPTVKEAFGSAKRFADKLSLWQGDINPQ